MTNPREMYKVTMYNVQGTMYGGMINVIPVGIYCYFAFD